MVVGAVGQVAVKVIVAVTSWVVTIAFDVRLKICQVNGFLCGVMLRSESPWNWSRVWLCPATRHSLSSRNHCSQCIQGSRHCSQRADTILYSFTALINAHTRQLSSRSTLLFIIPVVVSPRHQTFETRRKEYLYIFKGPIVYFGSSARRCRFLIVIQWLLPRCCT
jgi:hypothetical protein